MDKIKHFVEQSWLLIVAAFAFGLLLAVTNAAWQPRIIQNEKDKFENLAREMLVGETTFEIIADTFEVKLGKGKIDTVELQKAVIGDQHVGWAFICQGSGFADKIKLILVVDAGFENLKGFGVLSSNETPGFGDKITIKKGFYQKQFIGAPSTKLILSKAGDETIIDAEIISITGATVTSEAVVKILNTYILQIKTLLKEKGLI